MKKDLYLTTPNFNLENVWKILGEISIHKDSYYKILCDDKVEYLHKSHVKLGVYKVITEDELLMEKLAHSS